MATPAEVELSQYTAAHAPRLARFVVQAYATTYRGTTLPEDTLSHIVRTEGWTELIDQAAQTDTIIVAQSWVWGREHKCDWFLRK